MRFRLGGQRAACQLIRPPRAKRRATCCNLGTFHEQFPWPTRTLDFTSAARPEYISKSIIRPFSRGSGVTKMTMPSPRSGGVAVLSSGPCWSQVAGSVVTKDLLHLGSSFVSCSSGLSVSLDARISAPQSRQPEHSHSKQRPVRQPTASAYYVSRFANCVFISFMSDVHAIRDQITVTPASSESNVVAAEWGRESSIARPVRNPEA